MPREKKELAEQITPALREVEGEAGGGKTILESAKKIGAADADLRTLTILFAGGAKDHLPKTPRRIDAAIANTMLVDDTVSTP